MVKNSCLSSEKVMVPDGSIWTCVWTAVFAVADIQGYGGSDEFPPAIYLEETVADRWFGAASGRTT
jgi:hypothetical protein